MISFMVPLTITNRNARLTINKFSHTINKNFYLHFVDMCSTQLKVTASHNMADRCFKSVFQIYSARLAVLTDFKIRA
jgi:hypothetical protein